MALAAANTDSLTIEKDYTTNQIIPSKMEPNIIKQVPQKGAKKVGENGLTVEKMIPFVTPMRLGIILQNISNEVNESIKEIRGPRLGAPENAIDGFLKKNKIERINLQEKKTDNQSNDDVKKASNENGLDSIETEKVSKSEDLESSAEEIAQN